MPTDFTRPTLVELIARAKADVEGNIAGVNAALRVTVEYVLSRALAGFAHGLYGHIAWAAEQILPDQAVDRFVIRWANLFGVNRKQPEQSHGSITVTGSGGTLPAGTTFTRPSDGFEFTVDTTTVISSSSSVDVTAVDGGTIGDVAAGETLSLVSPIAGIDSAALVGVDGIIDGADLETVPELLVRLLDRIQHPPMGGAPGDYVTWTLEVPGVTRAWEYRGMDGVGNLGLGKVAVTFVLDDNAPDITPGPTKVAEVQAYLEARAPAEVFAFDLESVPLALTIQLVPNTPTVQAAVLAELQDMLLRDAEPQTPLPLSTISEAISIAQGEVSHVILSPTAEVTTNFGEILIFDEGSVTFV